MKRNKAKFKVGQVVAIAYNFSFESEYGRIERSVPDGYVVRRYDQQSEDFISTAYKSIELRPLTATERGPARRRK